MSKTYKYLISDFPYNKVDAGRLSLEIYNESDIYIGLDYINITPTFCDVIFKTTLSENEENTLASGIITNHNGEPLPIIEAPTMADGRPLVRADTRPLSTSTYFTMASDTAFDIGDGKELRWDFSDPENYPIMSGGQVCSCGFVIPDGYKAYQMDLFFIDPVYLKDGTVYFFDAPWGQCFYMSIVVPSGTYYPNEYGNISALDLGLSENDMYSYAAIDTTYYRYVNRHYVYGSCPMGDELNAEGAMVNALPVGWFIRGIILTPEDDNTSKGYASLEMYRERTILLSGG